MYSINIVDVTGSLPKGHNIYYRNRNKKEITTVIIHHTAIFNASIKSIAEYHINTKQWPGIGYHYIISHDDRIYKCNEETDISYHCSGHNSSSIGIAFNFDFNRSFPKQQSIINLFLLLLYLEKNFNIKEIKGHRDFNKTDCPGRNFNLESHLKNYEAWKKDITEISKFKLNFIKK